MTKKEMVALVAEKAGVSKAQAEKVLAEFVGLVGKELKAGEAVRVEGLGTFKVSKRAARKCRNPRTGAVVEVPAKKAVAFKAGAALKEAL